MKRFVLAEEKIHPAIRGRVAERNRDIVEEVQRAIADHEWVIVGMAQNPYPKKARKALDARGIAYRYLEYGSYTSAIRTWRRRNALKMWTGWPTFPMIFHNEVFIGGASDLATLLNSGEIAS